MKKEIKKGKSILYIIYILFTIGVLALIGLLDPQLKSFDEALSLVSLRWILVAVASMILFWITDTCIIHYMTSYLHKRQSIWASYKISMVGHFYSALTPFSSGGQPMQVVYMKREGMPPAKSTPLLIMKFLLWQMSVCIIGAIAVPLSWSTVFMTDSKLLILVVIGFISNFAVIGIGVLAIANYKAVYSVSRFFIRIGAALHIVRNKEKRYQSVEKFIAEYKDCLTLLFKNPMKTLITFLLTMAELVFYLAVTCFIYIACTGSPISAKIVFEVFLMQSVLSMAVSFIPLPGASGASEGGFYLFFRFFFSANMMFVVVIMWRMITYYLNLLAGFVIIIIDAILGARKKKLLRSEN
ncbi:MAG: lysylphosphatidylglycerol synthase transmembrane domain-containing protein [Christensenellales bacterium]